MKPPFSSWKYETGFLTAVRGGDAYELGYFTSRVEARKVALSFLDPLGPHSGIMASKAAMPPTRTPRTSRP